MSSNSKSTTQRFVLPGLLLLLGLLVVSSALTSSGCQRDKLATWLGRDVENLAEESFRFDERTTAIDIELAKLEAEGNTEFVREINESLSETLGRLEQELIPIEKETAWLQAYFVESVAALHRKLEQLPEDRQTLDWKKRLSELEKAWERGSITVEKSERPLVHWVHHLRLPSAPDHPTNQFELQLGNIDRPVMLVLSSQNHRIKPGKTEWRLKATDSSKIKAVVLCSPNDTFQCDTKVMVFHRQFWLWKSFYGGAEQNRRFVVDELGQRADVLLIAHEPTKTIHLDPHDAAWTQAYVVGELKSLEGEIQSYQNATFAASEPKLQFQGITATFNANIQTFTTVSQFNLFGPIAETKLPTKRAVWSFARVDERSAFALDSGRLITWKDDQDLANRWAAVTMPVAFQAGTSLRAVAYDSNRHRLLALDRFGESLLAFDIAESEWSLVRNDVGVGVGVTYDAKKDAIVIIRQRKDLRSPVDKQETMQLCLDANGERISEQLLACEQPMVTLDSFAGNELTLTNKYLIAVQQPTSNQRIPAEAVIRVFDLATGDMVYDHMMEPEPGASKYTNVPQNIRPTRYAAYRTRLTEVRQQIQRISELDATAARRFDERFMKLSDPRTGVGNNGPFDGDEAVKQIQIDLEELSLEIKGLLDQ